MSDEGDLPYREAMKAKKARFLEEAAAAFDRDMALGEHLAAMYPDIFSIKPGNKAAPKAAAETSAEPQKAERRSFDGSLAGLIKCYRTHPNSRVHKISFKTRENYANLLRRLEREHGEAQVETFDHERLDQLYKEWSAGGRIAISHSLVGMMRILATFGSKVLNDRACRELRVTLHDMKVPVAKKSRTEPLTEKQANDIRAKAHEMYMESIALAQAFQFDFNLRQADVIGEWVPIKEDGASEILDPDKGMKWLRGLRWNEIDRNLILRPGGRLKGLELDLKQSRMVMEELDIWGDLPASGPIIVSEDTDLPYEAHEFRRKWRDAATAAGVPQNVFNRDSRRSKTEAVPGGQTGTGQSRRL